MGKIINFRDVNKMKLMSKEKISKFNLIKYILFFANNTKRDLYKTKLNKLLFYTQFLYYKDNKERLLQDEFICDYHGPTISKLDLYLDDFEKSNFISKKKTEFGNVIIPRVVLKDEEYSAEELKVLYKVLNKFDSYTSARISEYSHKEKLWDEKNIKEVISIERAKELNEF